MNSFVDGEGRANTLKGGASRGQALRSALQGVNGMNKKNSIIATICAALVGSSAAFAANLDNYGAAGYAPASYAPADYAPASYAPSYGQPVGTYGYAPYAVPYAEEVEGDVEFGGEVVEEEKWISGSMVGSWYDGFLRKGNGHAANLNQIWLTGEKKVDTSVRPFDIGGRVDAIFGTLNAQCADGGFDGKWGVSGDGYATSLYQAYGEIGLNKLTAKIGKFGTLLGYEPVDNVPCALNTHTYMYNNEPMTHCGVLFNYAFADPFSIDFGMVAGSDNSFENHFGDTGFLFGATFSPDDNFSLSYASALNQTHADNFGSFSWGYYELGGAAIGDKNEYLQTVTLETQLSDQLGIALTTNYGTMEDRKEKLERFRQIGAAGYIFYKVTDKLDANVRYEYYTQKLVQEKVEARYHDVGFALIYRPTDHVFIRPDARYDWVDVGAKDDVFTGAVSCGLTF